MNNSNLFWPRHCFMALSLLALTTFSCSSDDTPLSDDTEAPTVSLAGIPDGGVVWNVVTLTASASDNIMIDKIEVEVDGLLIKSGVEDFLEVRLNTQELDDGEHTVTARAIDKAGNEKTAEAKIIVKNILISADVPADIFGRGLNYRGYILLSDETGKTIAVNEYHPGEQFQLKAPEFEGSEFYLTEVFYTQGGTALQTYTSVKRGEWVITGDNHIFGTNAGNVQLSFTNPLSDIDYRIIAANSEIASDGQFPTVLTMYTGSSKLLITREAIRLETNTSYPTHYAVSPTNVMGGNDYNIDLSTVAEPTIEQTAYSDFADGLVMLWGLADPTRPREMHRILTTYCHDHVLKYTYPGTAFPAYYHYYYYETDDGQYYHNLLDGLPNLDKLECSVDLATTNIRFTGTLSGEDVDACFINLSQGSQRWMIATRKGEVDIILPEVPEILLGKMVRSYEPSRAHVTATDFITFDGYEGLLDFVRSSVYGLEGFEQVSGPRQRRYVKYLYWNGGSGRRPSDQ